MPENKGYGDLMPEGYVPCGWHGFKASMWVGSVAHLAPAENVYSIRGGTDERVFGTICGRAPSARKSYWDSPDVVANDVRRGERTLCKRCVAKVSNA